MRFQFGRERRILAGASKKIIVAVLILGWWLGIGPAFAEKRIALMIGNSVYKNVPRLTNPTNDASLLAATLQAAGFDEVTTRLDATTSEMRMALRAFALQARDADVAVIYFAGHGIELGGKNYLIPIDATLETDTDVLDEAFPLDRFIHAVEPARRFGLVILDACRDNPFAGGMKQTASSLAYGQGLAKVEPSNLNTLVAFAAKAGSTATDGYGKNSPFAKALAQYLPKPGLDIRKALGFVRDEVLKSTGNKQEPYAYGTLGGDDMPLVGGAPVVAEPEPKPDNPARKDYEFALQLGTAAGWAAFLARYPDGYYADLARGQLSKIAAEEARAAAAVKDPRRSLFLR
jgi:Caspase domain